MSQTTVDEILTMSVQVRNVGLLTLRGERKWTAATEHGWLEAGGRAGRTTAARLAVFLRTVGKPRPRSVSPDARARGQAGRRRVRAPVSGLVTVSATRPVY